MARRKHLLALAALAALIAGLRWHTFDEPLERDLTTYAVIAHELLAGRALYSDLWDHKPPAIHLTYAAAELAVGYGPGAIYLLGVAAALATLGGVYWAAAVRGRRAGVAAAAFWAAIASDLGLQANQPNAEVFINAAAVSAIALLLRCGDGLARTRHALAGGALLALASLYKPNAALVAIAVAGAHLALRRGRRAAGTEVAAIAAMGGAAWLATGAWFAARGSLHDFIAAVFTYNRAYGETPLFNVARALRPDRLLHTALAPTAALAVLAVVGVGLGAWRLRRDGASHSGGLVLAYGAATYLAIALPGRFWPHYYQLWLPVLAIAASWSLVTLLPSERSFAVVAGLVFLLLVARQAPSYRLSADDWSRRKYGPVFVDTRDAAEHIDALLAPGETFYEWGSETGLYYESGRRPPSGVFYALPLTDGPLAAELSARVVTDLERMLPELVVVAASTPAAPSHPVVAWYRRRYRPIDTGGSTERFTYLARTGGRLDALTRAGGD